MAKVRLPLMSAEARGKVGALIYNTWRGFNTVKANRSPSQPRTSRQLLIRSFLTTCSRAWASLDSGERGGWNTYASAHTETDWTGSPKRLTGLDWFVRLTVRLLDLAKAQVDTAPTASAPAAVSSFTPTGGSGQISCAFTAVGGTATSIDIWTDGPHSAGRLASLVKARHRAYGPGETTPLVVSGLSPGIHTVYARMISETDGQASTWVSANATVT